MKFVISKQDLAQLAAKIQSIVPQKPAIPILSHLLVETVNNELILTATDLTVGMRCFTEAKIMEEGSATIPAKHFFQLIRELPNVGIEIATLSGGIAEIKAGPSTFKLHGLRKEDFPSLPNLQEAFSIKMSQKALKEALFQTAFAASREDTRYSLTGVFMQIADSTATFVGTDGKRLAKTSTEIEVDKNFKGSYIIPFKAVEELQKIIDDEAQITLHLMNDKIAVQTQQSTVITKLLSGDYPDFQRVIPKQTNVEITLHREELISLLRQVVLFTSDTHSSVRFSFNDSELVLTANSHDIGEGKVCMPINYSHAPIQIAFNPHFFLDILRHSKDETVTLGLIDSYNPGVIKDSTNALFVIMPMRLVDA
jgi:DNA polymerase-3 subunit beta